MHEDVPGGLEMQKRSLALSKEKLRLVSCVGLWRHLLASAPLNVPVQSPPLMPHALEGPSQWCKVDSNTVAYDTTQHVFVHRNFSLARLTLDRKHSTQDATGKHASVASAQD